MSGLRRRGLPCRTPRRLAKPFAVIAGWHGRSSREAVGQSGLEACPWCATTDLYIQKDFPQGLGLFIVVVGFAISTVFWYYEMPIPAYAVLLASCPARYGDVLHGAERDDLLSLSLPDSRSAGPIPAASIGRSTWQSASGTVKNESVLEQLRHCEPSTDRTSATP